MTVVWALYHLAQWKQTDISENIPPPKHQFDQIYILLHYSRTPDSYFCENLKSNMGYTDLSNFKTPDLHNIMQILVQRDKYYINISNSLAVFF
jgi:hypothetical protein